MPETRLPFRYEIFDAPAQKERERRMALTSDLIRFVALEDVRFEWWEYEYAAEVAKQCGIGLKICEHKGLIFYKLVVPEHRKVDYK